MSEPQRQYVTVDGHTLGYQRAGHGPTVLYLPGEGDRWTWEPWLAELARQYDVIVADHPSFGGSDVPAWLDDVHDLAYFYLDVIDALKLDRIHLIGHALGGWIACELAIRDAHRLASLTLIASAGLRVVGVPKLDTFIIPPEAVVRAHYSDQTLADAALAFVPSAEQADIALANRFATARLMWQPRHDLRLPKWLHRVTVPTLIIWGEDDQVIPIAYAHEFARLIPGARIAIIPHCGHLPHLEAPDAVQRALASILTTGAPA